MKPSSTPQTQNDNKLIMLGVGQTAFQVAKLATSYKLYGTTRDRNKLQLLLNALIEPFYIGGHFSVDEQKKLSELLIDAKILVSFPPNKDSDKFFSDLCVKSDTIIYLSSTSVYGDYSGIVDESTKVDRQNRSSKSRLNAEDIWLSKGASILRSPGLYSSASGLHLRLRNNTYRLPPLADNYISRIHLQDLAKIILAAFAKPLQPGSLYLVGDFNPAPQKEVIEWLCQTMNLPIPPLAAPDAVPATLISNRQVNASKILQDLKLQLDFPSYKEGYADCLAELNRV